MNILRSVGSFMTGGEGSAAGDGADAPDAKRVKRETASPGAAPRDGSDAAGPSGNGASGANGADAAAVDLGQYAQREIHLRKQEDDGELKYVVIKNDGETQHMVWLITLKNIFSKQLPNMPKEYIVRLVMNPNHHSMLCMKNGQVIGGITYRPFWRQNMGEIAFCAISSAEQVKGYGTRLMNHLKEYVCEKENMTHLITFADNNAVGYFAKQGFTKDVMMPREKWVGYIKEYDGGTIMECHLSAQVSYTDFPVMIREQRRAVSEKVRELSTAHLVHPGLKHFEGDGAKKPLEDPARQIPGLRDAGWTPPGPPRYRLVHPGCGDGAPTRENLHRFMRAMINLVTSHQDAWPFLDAINPDEVPDYYDVVKDPVYVELIKERVEGGEYYASLEMFAADFRLMFNNCRLYNAPDTVFFKCAARLEAFFEGKVQAGISWKLARGERAEARA